MSPDNFLTHLKSVNRGILITGCGHSFDVYGGKVGRSYADKDFLWRIISGHQNHVIILSFQGVDTDVDFYLFERNEPKPDTVAYGYRILNGNLDPMSIEDVNSIFLGPIFFTNAPNN